MTITINADELRKGLSKVVSDVRQGKRYTVLYRSQVAFDIVPSLGSAAPVALDQDPVYEAGPLGSSGVKNFAKEHDHYLYG